MDYIVFVECFKALEQFVGYFPDEFLFEAASWLRVLSISDLMLKITSICVFHQDAELLGFRVEEGAFVLDDGGYVDGGE